MKHLLTAIACFFALSMSAQTPYNPDSNGDNFVDIADFLDFLPNYGQDFYPAPVSPSSSVVVVTDNLTTELADHYIIPVLENDAFNCPDYDYDGANTVYIVTEPSQNYDAQFANGTLFEFVFPESFFSEPDVVAVALCSTVTYESGLNDGFEICESLAPITQIVIQIDGDYYSETVNVDNEYNLVLISVTYRYFEGSIIRLR